MTPDTPTSPQDDRRDRRRRRGPRLGTGLFLIALGLILAADQAHLIPFHRAAGFWPLILIALGLSRMVDRGLLCPSAHAVLGVGLIFELKALGYEEQVRHLWPLAVVWVGLILTLRALRARRDPSCGWLHD